MARSEQSSNIVTVWHLTSIHSFYQFRNPVKIFVGKAIIFAASLLACDFTARRRFFDRLENSDVCLPELYFLSEDDELTSFTAATALVERRRKVNSCEIVVKTWKKSPHVGHYLVHKQEYIEQIESFLDKYCTFEDD